MATTKIKQLESFDSGSNYAFEDKMLNKSIPRSMFDKSHRRIGTFAETGVIMPLGLFPTIPNESDDIEIEILLRALPSVVPLESRQRLYIYAFYSRLGDLWNNFNAFIRKGMTGDYDGKIPTLQKNYNAPSDTIQKARNNQTKNQYWENEYSIQANSLGEALGLPHSYQQTTKTIDNISITNYFNNTNYLKFTDNRQNILRTEISALPFMMYTRIWRDYFTNKNYWINNRALFPHDDEEFRLNDNGQVISYVNQNKKLEWDIASRIRDIQDNTSSETHGLYYHEYPKDRFTSALPFMQRGETPLLAEQLYQIGNEGGKLQIYSSDGTLKANSNKFVNFAGPSGLDFGTGALNSTPTGRFNFYTENQSFSISENDYLAVGSTSTGTIQLNITMNQLRKLAIEQSELEALARTDGSFAEFGLTFFGKVSKNAHDHKPVYIGGMYKEINYTEVVQTSASGETPMGSYTGHSTSIKSGYLGHIDTDDYGYIMILGCIMPDVLYTENLDLHWTNLKQEQFYLPQRAKLGMTPILKQEVRFYYDDPDNSVNTNLFAYQNIYDEMRYHSNEVHGYMADMFRLEYAPYTQSRIIANNPIWSREFALANKNNIRNDYLVAPNEPAFTYDMAIKFKCIQPVPYKPIPANLTGI